MVSSLVSVASGFVNAGVPADLQQEALDCFLAAKSRYYRGDFRPHAVEGGRFSEAVFRILLWKGTGSYPAIGQNLPSVDKMMTTLENLPGVHPSIRLHIPRTLRLIYDIRNRRDVAHLGDGIDPNYQDATLIIRNMEWVFAELIRLFSGLSPKEAHDLIVDVVDKEVPAIQEFDGFPRVLKDLKAGDFVLLILYWSGGEGVAWEVLSSWARPAMRKNLRRTVGQLEEKHFCYVTDDRVRLTRLGEAQVENRKLAEPIV